MLRLASFSPKSSWKLLESAHIIQKNILLLSKPNSIHPNITHFENQREFQRFFTKSMIPKSNNYVSPQFSNENFDTKKINEYESLCEQGDIKAINKYATSLLDGTNGVKRDPSKAARYFKIGSSKKDVESMFMYAICLFYGEGVKTDFSTAFSLFKETAERGKLDSEFYLYVCYHEGKGVDKNEDEALKYLKKSAENGFPSACTTLGMRYAEADPRRYEYFRKAAEQGEINGEFLYGIALVNGFGTVKKDVKKGLYYLKKSADGGNNFAQNAYGKCLLEGKLLPMDVKKAMHYYYLSASQGNSEGCYGYSHCLMKDDKVDFERALEYMKKAADLGHVDAMLEVSDMIIEELKIPTKEAMKYIRMACEKGSTTAMFIYAIFAEGGFGFDKKEPAIADEYLKKAAEIEKSAKAYKCYMEFLNRQGRYDEMQTYMKLAADSGDDDCQYHVAVDLLMKEKQEESEKYLKKAVEKENIDAMNLYASIIISKNTEEAANLLKKSIDKGSVPAMFNYATFLSEGKLPFIKDSKTEAFKYMKKAADKESEMAVITVANWLYEGFGCKKDIKESMKYYKIAADKFNSAISQYIYGVRLINGYDGCKPNHKEGALYIKKAADQDLPEANNSLACIYLAGIGVKKSVNEAVKYFKKAIDLGDTKAMHSYASLLFVGNEVKQNEKEAAKYFRQAADSGNAACMYNIGLLYLTGVGVNKDAKLGEKYLNKASENGYKHALEIGHHLAYESKNIKGELTRLLSLY